MHDQSDLLTIHCWVQAPPGVTKVLNLALATLSLKGGATTGGALAQGLLVTGPATYYAAVLQLAITGEQEEGRKAAVAALMQVPTQALPLSVILDSLLQVCLSHKKLAQAAIRTKRHLSFDSFLCTTDSLT